MDWLLLSIWDHVPVRQPSQPSPTAAAEPFRSRSSNAPCSCYLQSAPPYLDGWRKPCSHLLNNSFICQWANSNVPCMPCQDWTMHSPLKNGRFPIEVRISTSILKIRRSGNVRFIFPSSCYLCPFWDLTLPTHQSPPLPIMWPTGQLSNIYRICLSFYPHLSLWTQAKSVGGKRVLNTNHHYTVWCVDAKKWLGQWLLSEWNFHFCLCEMSWGKWTLRPYFEEK